jgi:hypothetical protein
VAAVALTATDTDLPTGRLAIAQVINPPLPVEQFAPLALTATGVRPLAS